MSSAALPSSSKSLPRPGRVLFGMVAALALFVAGWSLGERTGTHRVWTEPGQPIRTVEWEQPGATFTASDARVASPFSTAPVDYRYAWLAEAAWRVSYCLSGGKTGTPEPPSACVTAGALGYDPGLVVSPRELIGPVSSERRDRRLAVVNAGSGTVRVLAPGSDAVAYGFDIADDGSSATVSFVCSGRRCDRDRSARTAESLWQQDILRPTPERSWIDVR